MNQQNKHSRLPPSSAARRVACQGSRKLEEPFQGIQSQYSYEGNLAHAVAAQMLQGFFIPEDIHVTKEMTDGALLYFEYITKICGAFNIFIEERVDISNIHPECWGTPDCWSYNPIDRILHVFDYKFGHGYVDVFENWQLIEYSAGILPMIKTSEKNIKVHFHIIQPRSYHPEGTCRVWETDHFSLLPYFKTLQSTEHEAMKDITFCYVSSECTNCKARHLCQTLQKNTAGLIDVSLNNIPQELDGNQCGHELKALQRAAELIDARITGLYEHAMHLIRTGKQVAGYTAERSNGRIAWKVPEPEVEALGDMCGVNLLKLAEVITPRQAIKAGVPEQIVMLYTEIKHGALKLVPVNTRKIFNENN